MNRQISQVPQLLQARICQLASSMPQNPQQRSSLLQKYSQTKGYQFLNPKSKLYKHFNNKCNISIDRRQRNMEMQNQIKVTMEGNLQQISVGAMCQIVKQNISKGVDVYQPVEGQEYQQEFIFQRDQELFGKAVKLLHGINLQLLERKAQNTQDLSLSTNPQKSIDRNTQFRKQMTVKDDGSLGAWGGKKYEGLGVQNEFTSFRREQSMNYYNSTYFQNTNDRKKN